MDKPQVAIEAVPISKGELSDAAAGESGSKKNYQAHPQLYLGMLLQSMVLSETGGIVEKLGMEEYLTHLEQLGVKGAILEDLKLAAGEITSQLESGWEGYGSRVWFGEVPFVASLEQVGLVKELSEEAAAKPDKQRYRSLLREMGHEEAGIAGMVREMLTNPDWKARAVLTSSQNENTRVVELGIEEVLAVARGGEGLEDYMELDGAFVMLCERLAAVWSYAYFNFQGDWSKIGLEELAEHATRYQEVVMSASARVDLLGFAARSGDTEARELVGELAFFLAKIPGSGEGARRRGFLEQKDISHMGRVPLHDLRQYTREERRVMREVIELMAAGRIKMQLCEVKGQFYGETREAGQVREGKFVRNELPREHIKDVAHSVFAAYQLLARVANMREGGRIGGVSREEARALVEVMRRAPGDITGLREVMKFYRRLSQNGLDVRLARVFYPVRKIERGQAGERGRYAERFVEPDSADWQKPLVQVDRVSPKELLRELVGTGRSLLRRVVG